ncbi:MAG TPA: ribosome maturation factor RimP [Desulfobacterales bacterium]|nr:ribosome maturation factor RimP [Desulfobacterales bacterium]
MKAQRKRSKTKRPEASEEKYFLAHKAKIVNQVNELAESLCQAEGMELVYVEYQREPSGRTLRIYIDKPGGVTLDDCVNISRQLGDLLDVNLNSDGSYNLEISSPGSDRPLGKKQDFERFSGMEAKIRVAEPVDGRKNFKGILLGISGDVVTLLVDDKTVAIAFQNISRARLVNYNGENGCL